MRDPSTEQFPRSGLRARPVVDAPDSNQPGSIDGSTCAMARRW
jgi:hypothetical protein